MRKTKNNFYRNFLCECFPIPLLAWFISSIRKRKIILLMLYLISLGIYAVEFFLSIRLEKIYQNFQVPITQFWFAREGVQGHKGWDAFPITRRGLFMQLARSFRSNGSNTFSSLLLWFSVLLISLGTLPHLIPYYFQLNYWFRKIILPFIKLISNFRRKAVYILGCFSNRPLSKYFLVYTPYRGGANSSSDKT